MNITNASQQEETMSTGHHHPHHPEDHHDRYLATELAQIIEETDWQSLTKRLLVYTRYRLARHGSAANRYGSNAEDYVQEAVALLFEGKRHFVPAPDRSLFRFLCGVVDSIINHSGEKARRRGTQLFIGNEAGEDGVPGGLDEEHLASDDDFEEQIIARDELERFMESLEPDLERYVRLLAADQSVSAEEHALSLGTSVSEIRNMDRRLRRRRNQWSRT
jgi:DNA-directed RNA polymerase specialized sigma24 family protein